MTIYTYFDIEGAGIGIVKRKRREMDKETKNKQIVIRFDNRSYIKIKERAEIEHRGLGEFVRHATLDYIEKCCKEKPVLRKEASRDES